MPPWLHPMIAAREGSTCGYRVVSTVTAVTHVVDLGATVVDLGRRTSCVPMLPLYSGAMTTKPRAVLPMNGM